MKVISQYNSMATVHQLRDLKYIPSENANMREDTHTHTHTHTKWTTGGRKYITLELKIFGLSLWICL